MEKFDVYLVRHGETNSNVHNLLQGTINTRLNEHGRKNTKRVSKWMKKSFSQDEIDSSAFYTSDLRRAYETCKICLDDLGVSMAEVKLDKRLRELNYGNFQGKQKRKLLEYFPSGKITFNEKLGGNCHSGTIRSLVSNVMKYPIEKIYKYMSFQNHSVTKFTLRKNMKKKDCKKFYKLYSLHYLNKVY